MMSLVTLIQDHIEYDSWANTRLLDAAEQLTPERLNYDFGSADKSVKGTLVHLFRGSRVWLGRVEQGTPSTPWGLPEDDDWPSLHAKWSELQLKWKEWAAHLTDAETGRILEYTDLRGKPWAQPLWQIALHVVNHGTHHRGQVSAFLRASGLVPPPLDYIAFARLQPHK
jgi:uncharacterized damage-inducible protein DinB